MATDPVEVKSYAECVCQPYIRQVRLLQEEVERLRGLCGVRCAECKFKHIEKPEPQISSWRTYCEFHGTQIGGLADAGRHFCSWGVRTWPTRPSSQGS